VLTHQTVWELSSDQRFTRTSSPTREHIFAILMSFINVGSNVTHFSDLQTAVHCWLCLNVLRVSCNDQNLVLVWTQVKVAGTKREKLFLLSGTYFRLKWINLSCTSNQNQDHPSPFCTYYLTHFHSRNKYFLSICYIRPFDNPESATSTDGWPFNVPDVLVKIIQTQTLPVYQRPILISLRPICLMIPNVL